MPAHGDTLTMLKLVASALLIILGLVMVWLGLRAGIQAPVVTGLGFFVIAVVFAVDGLKARR